MLVSIGVVQDIYIYIYIYCTGLTWEPKQTSQQTQCMITSLQLLFLHLVAYPRISLSQFFTEHCEHENHAVSDSSQSGKSGKDFFGLYLRHHPCLF